jgi:hypothetical protein
MVLFFYISGIVLWTVLAIIGLYFLIPTAWKFIEPVGDAIRNIKFYFFGAKWLNDVNCAEIYFSKYRYRPGVIAHWRSRKCFRRLAYARFLKEARKDMPEYLENQRKTYSS